MPHKPKKSLGQNFLNDRHMQQKLVNACGLTCHDHVLEIGPGQGAMTRLIAPKVKHLTCVETDRDLILPLRQEFQDQPVDIVHADFLQWNMNALPPGIKVIGNIPYYISTPIIEKLIDQCSWVSQAFLTVQLEFGKRMAAQAGSKEYGSLSLYVQYHADIKLLFNIKKTYFHPVPKVDSCFVQLDFKSVKPAGVKDEALLFKVIRTSFTQRRKNILNALLPIVSKDRCAQVLSELGIETNTRPEQLNLEKFIAISNKLL